FDGTTRLGRGSRCAGQVVDDGQPADAGLGGQFVDLVGEPGERLGRCGRVHQHAPGLYQLAGRVALDDLAVDDHLGHRESVLGGVLAHLVSGGGAVPAARAKVVVDRGGIAVADRPFRLGDGVPDLLWGGFDVDAVDLGGDIGGGCHGSLSSSLLRSTSAVMGRSVN